MRPIISAPSATGVAQSPSSSRITQPPVAAAPTPAPPAAVAKSAPPTAPTSVDVQSEDDHLHPEPALQNNATGSTSNGTVVKKAAKSSEPAAPKPVSAAKPPPSPGKLSWKSFLPNVTGKGGAGGGAGAPLANGGTKGTEENGTKKALDGGGNAIDENNNEIAAPSSPSLPPPLSKSKSKSNNLLPNRSSSKNDDGAVAAGGGVNGTIISSEKVPHGEHAKKENGVVVEPGKPSEEKQLPLNGEESNTTTTATLLVGRRNSRAGLEQILPTSANGAPTSSARKESGKSEMKVKLSSSVKESTVATVKRETLASKPPSPLDLKRSPSGTRLAREMMGEKPSNGGTVTEGQQKVAVERTASSSSLKLTGAPIGVRLSLKPPNRTSVTPDRGPVKPRASPSRADDGMPKEKSPSERKILADVVVGAPKVREKTPLRTSASSKSLAKLDGEKEPTVSAVNDGGTGGGGDVTAPLTSTSSGPSRPVVKVRKVIKKIIKKKPKATTEPGAPSPVEGEKKDVALGGESEGVRTVDPSSSLVGTVETTITHETADSTVVKGIVEISKVVENGIVPPKKEKKKDKKEPATEKEAMAKEGERTVTDQPCNGATTGEEATSKQSERKHWAMKKRAMADRAMSCGPLEGLPNDLLEQFLFSLATMPQEIAVDLPVGAPLPKYGSNRSLARSASQYLSGKIQDFLRRTDHVMQDWRNVGRSLRRRGDVYGSGAIGTLGDVTGLGAVRSRSVSNIITRGLQLLKEQSPRRTSGVSRSSSRASSSFYCELPVQKGRLVRRGAADGGEDDDDDCSTVVDMSEELSDVTSELTEEHSSSNLITERLAAETSERLRLEKEVKEYESKYRNLQESSEKMEMELLCAKSELNCDFDDCSTIGDYDGDGGGMDGRDLIGGVDGEVAKSYRLRYERVARELEFTKKRLQTQHEHDLEQLVGLKKQLEKKLADAYEEVEEQRQVVAQWKRKAQKTTNEMNDLRMLYEEQNSRNNLLEKRQRKFDAECQTLQDTARQERQAKERLAREKDVLMAEKCKLEQTMSDVRLELELKEEKNNMLQRELDEMAFGGGTEEEIAQLKRQKMELDRRCKEQDEELDEMAGQIQLLEQAKLRLEMSLETIRKEARKEAQQRDDEMEEIRGASYKKVKSLECQLEQEHEERTQLLRDKHELERRLNSLEDQDRAERAAEEAMVQRLKRDARKYRALLRDAQSQLERAKGDSASKALVRQLRNQLEDAESARTVAAKARQVLEGELQDAQMLIEETQRARNEAEEKATAAQRDRTELQAQIDENEEELAELMKKYSSTVKQLSSEQSLIAEYELRLSELEGEKRSLKEQVVELAARLENVETIGDSSNSMQFKRLELRTKEVESRLEFEQATRARIEIQLNRHKDSLEKLQGELSQARNRESQAQDSFKKAQKTIRELRDELSSLANRDQENLAKRKELEKRIETAEQETATARTDLRLALQRIADLQQAMEEEGDSYQSDSDTSDSSSSMDSFHESSVTRKSPSVGSGEHFGATTNGSVSSSRGGSANLVGSTRDGRKESNNPRITLTMATGSENAPAKAPSPTASPATRLSNGNDGALNDSSFA
uniref:Myosin tail domain-containing protein n=1 Tax=Anopheles atroparvus TaxID=41427 RepID=A0AAG5DML8_ANOAO